MKGELQMLIKWKWYRIHIKPYVPYIYIYILMYQPCQCFYSPQETSTGKEHFSPAPRALKPECFLSFKHIHQEEWLHSWCDYTGCTLSSSTDPALLCLIPTSSLCWFAEELPDTGSACHISPPNILSFPSLRWIWQFVPLESENIVKSPGKCQMAF